MRRARGLPKRAQYSSTFSVPWTLVSSVRPGCSTIRRTPTAAARWKTTSHLCTSSLTTEGREHGLDDEVEVGRSRERATFSASPVERSSSTKTSQPSARRSSDEVRADEPGAAGDEGPFHDGEPTCGRNDPIASSDERKRVRARRGGADRAMIVPAREERRERPASARRGVEGGHERVAEDEQRDGGDSAHRSSERRRLPKGYVRVKLVWRRCMTLEAGANMGRTSDRHLQKGGSRVCSSDSQSGHDRS